MIFKLDPLFIYESQTIIMSKKEIKIFEYEGEGIIFEFEDGTSMVNATQMMKSFPSKKMNNFLRTSQTKEFIKLYSQDAKKRYGNDYKVLRVVRGGNDPALRGTWMDERLALKFAAWLSPAFEIWVWDRIHELLATGQTSLQEEKERLEKERKGLEWIFQKIKDNAMEIHHLSDYLEDVKRLNDENE